MNNTIYPYEIRDVPPFEGAIKLEMPLNSQGMREGVHSGGPWLDPEHNEVWKPMLALVNRQPDPYFVENRNELKLLIFANDHGIPCFPPSWRIESTRDGRGWIVRPRLTTLDKENYDSDRLTSCALEVEQSLRQLNRLGWEVGDSTLCVMLDDDWHPVIVDGSCAMDRRGSVGAYAAQDWHNWLNWINGLGLTWLANLRQAGAQVTYTYHKELADLEELYNAPLVHVYLSDHRPFSLMWADKFDGEQEVLCATLNRPLVDTFGIRGYTWLVTARPLSEEYQRRYELTWAYSPTR